VSINRRQARLEQAARKAAQGRADADPPWAVFPDQAGAWCVYRRGLGLVPLTDDEAARAA
jgi:hypothetical protein